MEAKGCAARLWCSAPSWYRNTSSRMRARISLERCTFKSNQLFPLSSGWRYGELPWFGTNSAFSTDANIDNAIVAEWLAATLMVARLTPERGHQLP